MYDDTGTIISKDTPMITHSIPSAKKHSDCTDSDIENHFDKDVIGKTEAIINVLKEKLSFLYNRSFWAYGFVGACIVNVSGYAWDDAHRPGMFYTTYTKDGGSLSLVADGDRQTGFEFYLVIILMMAFINGMLKVMQSFGNMDENEKEPKWVMINLGHLLGLSRKNKIDMGMGLMTGSFLILLSLFYFKINS